MKKHSVSIDGHKTSFSLEEEFLNELKRLAAKRNISMANLIRQIDHRRKPGQNLSSALRVHVLEQLKAAANPD